MTYYKALNEDGSCFHGGVGSWPLPTRNEDGTWTPGAWLEVAGEIEACENGLHACRDEQVLGWLGPAMFELEYDGEPEDAGDKVIGRRARLLRRFEAWGERTARLFACDCAERVLPIYERDYPNESRPRMAIEMARRFAKGNATRKDLAAARDAAWDAARDSARAAAWVAAWVAALDAALEATEWAAASDAAWATERAWQFHRLCEYLEG